MDDIGVTHFGKPPFKDERQWKEGDFYQVLGQLPRLKVELRNCQTLT